MPQGEDLHTSHFTWHVGKGHRNSQESPGNLPSPFEELHYSSASDDILYMLDHYTIENFVFQIIVIRRNYFFPASLVDLKYFIMMKLHFYSQWCSLGFCVDEERNRVGKKAISICCQLELG